MPVSGPVPQRRTALTPSVQTLDARRKTWIKPVAKDPPDQGSSDPLTIAMARRGGQQPGSHRSGLPSPRRPIG